jgi:hypothetical protein
MTWCPGGWPTAGTASGSPTGPGTPSMTGCVTRSASARAGTRTRQRLFWTPSTGQGFPRGLLGSADLLAQPGPPGHPQGPQASHPQVADRDRLRDHQPHLRPGQPRPPRGPRAWALGDRERPALRPRCHLHRGRSASEAARRSWPACATWSSACSAVRGRSTSPPPSAATPETTPAPSPPSASHSDAPNIARAPWSLGGRRPAQDEASRNPSEPTASRRNAAGELPRVFRTVA